MRGLAETGSEALGGHSALGNGIVHLGRGAVYPKADIIRRGDAWKRYDRNNRRDRVPDRVHGGSLDQS